MKTHKPIKKAIITAAGYGTRFLPATKYYQKELLPLLDKPILHYIVDEVVASGVRDIIFITRDDNHSIQSYFEASNYELEEVLLKGGKTKELSMIQQIPNMANFMFIRQKKELPYGNGTPLLVVKDFIEPGEAFLYIFGDDLTISETPVCKQLIDVYNKQQPSAILAVQEVPEEEVYRYGSIKYKDNPRCKFEVERVFEKVPKGEAPSNMAQFGRFLLTYDILQKAEETPVGKNNELWIADIISRIVEDNKLVLAQPIEGKWLTTGDPLRYLQATIEIALARKDLNGGFKEYLRTKVC